MGDVSINSLEVFSKLLVCETVAYPKYLNYRTTKLYEPMQKGLAILIETMSHMKEVTVGTYKKDTLYPKVVRATASVLKNSDEISPLAILLQMGNLERNGCDAWQRGQVAYLENVFQGSLSKANRILRIIGFHAHDLKMIPSQHTYRRKGNKIILRFSKSGIKNIENSYAHHFQWNQSQDKKQAMIEKTLQEHHDY